MVGMGPTSRLKPGPGSEPSPGPMLVERGRRLSQDAGPANPEGEDRKGTDTHQQRNVFCFRRRYP